MMPASRLHDLSRLAVVCLGCGWARTPGAVVRPDGVGVHRLPVLRRRDGRDVLHRRLGDHAWERGEVGVGNGAITLTGIGGADAKDLSGNNRFKVVVG